VDVTFTLGAVFLVGAVVALILEPLVTGRAAPMVRSDDERTDAEAERRVKLLALRDVEYDYAMGKLDERDYRALRRELSAEALAALDRSDDDAATLRIEEEIARVRAGLKNGATCSSCGYVNRAGSRFCSTCGGALGATADATR
jgi:hypothetical protein